MFYENFNKSDSEIMQCWDVPIIMANDAISCLKTRLLPSEWAHSTVLIYNIKLSFIIYVIIF